MQMKSKWDKFHIISSYHQVSENILLFYNIFFLYITQLHLKFRFRSLC